VAISCLVSFIIAEIAFRNLTLKYSTYLEKVGFITYISQYNPRSHIWHKSDNEYLHIRIPDNESYPKSVEFKYIHAYNYLGLRGVLPEINDSTYLLITLGDSFTEGFGASVDSTWAYIMSEYILAENNHIRLLNAAIGGSDVFYEYFKLKNHLLPIYQPDEVIIAVNSSDIQD
jgi:hypothetical protein